MIEVTKTSNKT